MTQHYEDNPWPDPGLLFEIMSHEYRVYHNNSNERVVATTMGYAVTPEQAISAAMAYAVAWNLTETRENMIVTFLECEGVEVPVK